MNKIKVYYVCILICIVFVSLSINSSYSQSLDNRTSNNRSIIDFITYTNNDMNFSIKHPSSWKVQDFSKFYPEVSFKIPDRREGLQRFETRLEISTVSVNDHLDTDTITRSTVLEQYFQQEVSSIQSDYDKKLVNQNKVTVAGNAAWKVEYTKFYYYTFNIFTIANGNFYKLSYTDEKSKVPETLPIVNEMVESFRFVG